MPERTCDAATRRGRARKADEFRPAAEVIEEYAGSHDDLNDAYVTLCVHAGIAAADVVCCARLGVHHEGRRHHDAVALLARASTSLTRDLETLLKLKTRSGYSAVHASSTHRKQARRAMNRLVDAARESAAG